MCIEPGAEVQECPLTTRWSGPGIQRQKQEMIEIALLEKNVRKRIPAAQLTAVRLL